MTSLFEQKHVTDVYNKIAPSFNKTRWNHWHRVKEFLNSLEPGSKVLDAGCGNGKNMKIRTDLDFTGCDTSENLLQFCRDAGHHVVNASIRDLPFKDYQFDSVICIAVLHHLYSDRTSAVRELLRVLKPGGTLFLQVWAREQDLTKQFVKQGTPNDFFVSWTDGQGNVSQRYYHLFPEKEIDELITDVSNMTLCVEKGFECNNWFFILRKKTS